MSFTVWWYVPYRESRFIHSFELAYEGMAHAWHAAHLCQSVFQESFWFLNKYIFFVCMTVGLGSLHWNKVFHVSSDAAFQIVTLAWRDRQNVRLRITSACLYSKPKMPRRSVFHYPRVHVCWKETMKDKHVYWHSLLTSVERAGLHWWSYRTRRSSL